MNQRRIYPMGSPLTEEQIAVAFAMCSRSPDAFDASAQKVSEARAAKFNERWVTGYGHASVAEHATIHLAMENVSRICADHVEDGRLSSYTEKSSRYQVVPANAWHVPSELTERALAKSDTGMLDAYCRTMANLMERYQNILQGLADAKRDTMPRRNKESDEAWLRRRRRESLDDARSLLPAATLTNLGITANARSLAYLISRLASSQMLEVRAVAQEMHAQGSKTFPSLLRHAEPTNALRRQQTRMSTAISNAPVGAVMTYHLPDAPAAVAQALRFTGLATSGAVTDSEVIRLACLGLGDHDQPSRQFEIPTYGFDVTLDYGALRELRRHRMMTLIRRPLTALSGYDIPASIADAGMSDIFETAMGNVQDLHVQLTCEGMADTAQYAVCHAHRQTVKVQLNLRQLRNMARLRTQLKAHPGIRLPIHAMVDSVGRTHPELHDAVLAPIVTHETP